jgi:predicted kinase
LAQLQAWTAQQFAECRALMQERSESGFIRECHGDLHLGNIVVIDGQPVPFDCIEFNEEMRWIDVIDEVAFLVMDLEAHDVPELGYRLLNRYLQITGDFQGLALLDYYRVYRALVRAKVALLSRDHSSGDQAVHQAFETRCLHYLSVARACLSKAVPLLMITHGLSGSGKSTIAARIAENLPAIQLRSDVERKRFALIDDRFKHALYSEETTRITYRRLAEIADGLLKSGFSVIVDATFLKQIWRDQFRLLAEKLEVGFLILDFQAPPALLRERIAKRLIENKDPSDADLKVLESQIKNRDPLSESEIQYSVSIRSEQTEIGELVQRIIDRVQRDRKTQFG